MSILHTRSPKRKASGDKNTYGAVRFFAKELVLERDARGQVHCRPPHGVIRRIQWYLYDVGKPIVLRCDSRTYRAGRVPVTELRHVAPNKNVLSRDLSQLNAPKLRTLLYSPRHMLSSHSQRRVSTPALPASDLMSQPHTSSKRLCAPRSPAADRRRRPICHRTRSGTCGTKWIKSAEWRK